MEWLKSSVSKMLWAWLDGLIAQLMSRRVERKQETPLNHF